MNTNLLKSVKQGILWPTTHIQECGMTVLLVTMATDVTHKIKAKCQLVHQYCTLISNGIKEDSIHGKKIKKKKTSTKIENVLLC